MRPVSRIHQCNDLPSMAEAVGRETSMGGHIVYLDRMLSRVAKPLRLRTVMRALGWSTARRDAAIAGFVAWKSDSKAKTVTSTAVVAVTAGVAATVIGLTAGHHGDRQGPLQRPVASAPAYPVRPFSKPAEAPRAPVRHTSSPRSSPRPVAATASAGSQPADVMSYAPAQPTAPAALRPSPEPGTPSTPPPAAPSTPQAGPSSRAAPPGATKGGICVVVEPLLSVCVG